VCAEKVWRNDFIGARIVGVRHISKKKQFGNLYLTFQKKFLIQKDEK